MDIPYDEQISGEYYTPEELPSEIVQKYREGIYAQENINELLEDDELSFEEAAFMTGYCDFA